MKDCDQRVTEKLEIYLVPPESAAQLLSQYGFLFESRVRNAFYKCHLKVLLSCFQFYCHTIWLLRSVNGGKWLRSTVNIKEAKKQAKIYVEGP